MVFSSIEFLLLFLPPLFALYFCVPQRFRGIRNMVLLVFSIVFYAYGGVKYLWLLFVSIGINYAGALLVACLQKKQLKTAALVLSVAGNLGLLFYFKYMGFFVECINGLGAALPIPQIVLPIGISFYTFQGLSYVVDVYRGDAMVQKNPLWVALYIAFFPQLVAGPIVRYVTIADELENRTESVDGVYEGMIRFLFGFGKKMLLANRMGEIADQIFPLGQQMTVSLAWLGAVAYTMQIYFDFSAYSDMAIGLGRVFGFHFEENFRYPYIAKSITEFWRRWHISLSTWFRDYVYIPLGGNRKGPFRHIRNIVVVWFLTGMWHGAAWNFILWGGWFCILLLGEKYLWGGLLEKIPAFFRHLITMLLVMISWVLFRCETLPDVIRYLSVLSGADGMGLTDGRTIYYLMQYRWELLACLVAAMPVKEYARKLLEQNQHSAVCRFLLRDGVPMLGVFIFLLSYIRLVTGSFNPFIYFRF